MLLEFAGIRSHTIAHFVMLLSDRLFQLDSILSRETYLESLYPLRLFYAWSVFGTLYRKK